MQQCESRIRLLVFTIKQRERLDTDRLKVKCCHKHWRDLLHLVLSPQVVYSTPRKSFSRVMASNKMDTITMVWRVTLSLSFEELDRLIVPDGLNTEGGFLGRLSHVS